MNYMKWIKLTKGKRTMVDNEDFEKLSQYKWCYAIYAIRGKKGEKGAWKMHWDIMGKPKNGLQIDHINGNKLDNRRKNLRVVTDQQNKCNRGKISSNTSGYKGVTWRKDRKTWHAQIQINRKVIHLGHYKSKLQAYKKYCEACIKYHGEFANTK